MVYNPECRHAKPSPCLPWFCSVPSPQWYITTRPQHFVSIVEMVVKRRRRSCQDTQGADSPASFTLSGVCPEGETCSHLARPSLLHFFLGQGQHAGFETNQSRRQENFLRRKDLLQLRSTPKKLSREFRTSSGYRGITSPTSAHSGNPRRHPRPKQLPREHLRCAQCGSDRAAHVASSDHGLMLHMGQKHGGQRLLSEGIGQLRHVDRGACVLCRHTVAMMQPVQFLCNSYTPLRELRVGDTTAGSLGMPMDPQLLQSSQPVPPGEPLDDSPLPNCPIRNIVLTDRDKFA